MATSDYERQMEEEIKRRVEEIESEDYDLGEPFSKANWVVVGCLFVVALALVLIGGAIAG